MCVRWWLQNEVNFGCRGHQNGEKFGFWGRQNGVKFDCQGHPNGVKFQALKKFILFSESFSSNFF